MNNDKIKELFNEVESKTKLIIDPTIDFENDIKEIIISLKIKLQSYMNNDCVSINLYHFMKTYLSDYAIDEVMSSSLDTQHKRNIFLNTIIKNDN